VEEEGFINLRGERKESYFLTGVANSDATCGGHQHCSNRILIKMAGQEKTRSKTETKD